MSTLIAVENWLTDIKVFVNTQISDLAFTAIIVLLSVTLLALFRHIVKYAFNVNVIKTNMILPILISVLDVALLIFLCTIRYA